MRPISAVWPNFRQNLPQRNSVLLGFIAGLLTSRPFKLVNPSALQKWSWVYPTSASDRLRLTLLHFGPVSSPVVCPADDWVTNPKKKLLALRNTQSLIQFRFPHSLRPNHPHAAFSARRATTLPYVRAQTQ